MNGRKVDIKEMKAMAIDYCKRMEQSKSLSGTDLTNEKLFIHMDKAFFVTACANPNVKGFLGLLSIDSDASNNRKQSITIIPCDANFNALNIDGQKSGYERFPGRSNRSIDDIVNTAGKTIAQKVDEYFVDRNIV